MMWVPLGAALLLMPLTALAQQTPPAPRPPTVQSPGNTPAGPQPQQAAPPGAPAPASPAPNAWLQKPVAELVALDKVTARSTPLTVRVGQTAAFGSLSINVRACDVRPPDQPADATAFLDVTDSHPGGPQFHGWMLVSAPAVSMLQHPIYDVRVAGCHE